MGTIALLLFLYIYAYGAELLGVGELDSQMQVGLFLCFVLGIICGYRVGGSSIRPVDRKPR